MERSIRFTMGAALAVLLVAIPCAAAQLTPAAQQDFDNYAASVESRLVRQHSACETYLATLNANPSGRTDAINQLRAGSLVIQSVNGGAREVPGGLLHHWRGAAFVPGAKPQDMLALLRDYDGLARYYAPDVETSRALEQHAEVATVAMRMKKQKVVTVVLDTQYDVQTRMTAANCGYSISRSKHIWEVEWPGTTHERHMKEGDDDGFLWRLNSYWSFVELPDGLLIECEAVSLTRDIPSGLGWLAAPIIEQLPRESLEFTLKATRNALAANAAKGIHL